MESIELLEDIYCVVLQLSSNLILHLLISVTVQIKTLHPDLLTERHIIFSNSLPTRLKDPCPLVLLHHEDNGTN